MPQDLLTLPFAIQVALSSGYLAYLVAFAGLRSHHTTTDMLFRVFVFSSLGTAIFYLLPNDPILAAALATLVSLVLALFWRKYGNRASKFILRKLQVSWSDDVPSAWLSITAERTDLRPSQIVVQLRDGRLLMCEDTRKFANAPFGPCMFGLEGSVAMYVTAEMRPNGEWIEQKDVIHPHEGARITHIPASEIARSEIRHWQKSTGAVARVEEEVDLA